jgi:cell division protein FtsX
MEARRIIPEVEIKRAPPVPEVRPKRVFEEAAPTPAGCMSMFGLGLCIGVFIGFIIAYLVLRKAPY